MTKGGPDANDLTIEELDGYQWFGTFIRKAQPGEPDYVRPSHCPQVSDSFR